jgi:hypothetical protein
MTAIATVLYLSVGLLANVLTAHRPRLAARAVVLLAWPVLLCYEGTPTMAKFIRWAER